MELLNGGAAADKPDDFGCTPLHLASVSRSKPMVRALLNQGANPNGAGAQFNTLLKLIKNHREINLKKLSVTKLEPNN